jgi:hypothetical protein
VLSRGARLALQAHHCAHCIHNWQSRHQWLCECCLCRRHIFKNGHSQHNTLHPIFSLPDRAVGQPSVCCSGCPGQLLGPWKLQQQVQSSLRTLQAFPGSSAQSGGHRPAVGPESCPAATAATEYASMLWPSHFMAMFLAPWAERRSHHRSLPPLGAINWWSHSLKE